MNITGFLLQNKVVVALSVLLFAFFISTISLAVQKNNAKSNLNKCQTEFENCTEHCTDGPPAKNDPPAAWANVTRLPPYVIPISYDLLLYPDLDNGTTFTGRNLIRANLINSTNIILLNAHNLTITSVVVADKAGTVIPNTHDLIEDQERLKITLSDYHEEELVITIDFVGCLSCGIVGLYKSVYNTEEGVERAIATSKFEPTYARQAFPCFDEPAMKATYKISLQIPNNGVYHALSNMPEDPTKEQDNGDGTKTVHFLESKPMSSYLACFIVSDFVFKEKNVTDSVTMRVFATPAQLDKVDFALDTGVSITKFYIDYFGVDYPLPKLDMAAIPDFVSGAMEHWGLVTFRETALLYQAGTSSTANKHRVATVIAHELAHMWFGNLVTMAWWDELWLNEGFASYIEYKGTNEVYPEWKMMDQFLIDDLHAVLTLDATLASHPIVQTVNTPDEITEVFDTITYNKGAAVIRMMEDFVGPEKFKTGVTNYLKKHEYGNAVTGDLLEEIHQLNLDSDFDVKYVMSTWTEQMGFPVVSVKKISDTEYELTQTRFFSNPDNAIEKRTDSSFNYLWYIPITYQTDNSSEVQRTWFENVDTHITVNFTDAPQWIKFNKDQIGYYRVKYSEDMWATLTDVLTTKTEELSISDRAQLINDAFSLAEATLISYDIALDLTNYLKNEHQYVPWSVASTNLLNLKNRLNTTSLDKIKKFGQTIIGEVYNEVGWQVDDDHLKNNLRTTVLNFACSVGLPACLEEAGKRFNGWLNGDVVDPDLRNVVYYYGMASVGNAQKWDQMWGIYMNATDASEKARLIYGLSGIKDFDILNKFVELAWEPTNVRGQDYFTCMQNIAANPIGESIVWNYVRSNWEMLVDRFTLNDRYLGRMIPSICGRFSTALKLEEVNAFFKKYEDAGAGKDARQQTLEDIANRIKWLEENRKKVADWLDENVKSESI